MYTLFRCTYTSTHTANLGACKRRSGGTLWISPCIIHKTTKQIISKSAGMASQASQTGSQLARLASHTASQPGNQLGACLKHFAASQLAGSSASQLASTEGNTQQPSQLASCSLASQLASYLSPGCSQEDKIIFSFELIEDRIKL